MIEFSLCLLFAKLVSYTFLYWLPLYISNVGMYPEKERWGRGLWWERKAATRRMRFQAVGRTPAEPLLGQKEVPFLMGS